jgi:hypothetical protein
MDFDQDKRCDFDVILTAVEKTMSYSNRTDLRIRVQNLI